MTYTTTRKIYDNSDLTNEDISEPRLEELISDATYELNKEINSLIVRERVLPLDSFRENQINGSNKKFYVRKSLQGYYFGDRNNDGDVTIADIEVIIRDYNDVETVAVISAIDYEDMSFTLESAPSSNTQAIFVTYMYTIFDVKNDRLIEMATRYLVTSYAYAIDDYSLGENVKIGNISVSGLGKSSSASKAYARYEQLLNKIKSYGNTDNLPVTHIRI